MVSKSYRLCRQSGKKSIFASACRPSSSDGKSRFRKSEQGDKWNFCLTAGKIGPRIRRDDEQTSTSKSLTGLQGEGGAGGHQGRPDDSPTGRAFRRSPQSDYGVEIAA